MTTLSFEALQEFFIDSPQPMWVFDMVDGRYIAVNRATEETYGYTQEEFLRMSLPEICAPSEAPRLEAALATFRKLGRLDKPTVWEHRTKAGNRLFVEVLANRVQVGEIEAAFVVLRDVTREHVICAERDRVFNLSQDIIVVRSFDQSLLKANLAVERILGWSREEFQSMKPADVAHPEDRETVQSILADAIATGSSRNWQSRVRTKGGCYRWLDWTCTVDTEQKHLYAVARDITSTRLMTERIRESEANLAWAQGVSHLGSWSLDLASGVFKLSDEYYRITGYEPGGYEPTWENILRTIHPEDRCLVETGAPKLSDKHQELEVRIARPTGEIRIVHSYVEAEFDSSGQLVLMHGTIRDITEEKKAEETQTWLAEIVSSSSEAIIGKTLDGTIQSWNRAAERLYGYRASEMIGQSVSRLLPQDRKGELLGILETLARGCRIDEYETQRVDRHGRILDVSLTISPIRTKQGKVVGAAAICRDISVRKEAERLLRGRLDQLTALRKIDLSIAGTFDLAKTLQIVACETLAGAGTDSVSVFTKDRLTGRPKLMASGSKDDVDVPQKRLLIAADLAAKVLQMEAPIEGATQTGPLGQVCYAHALMAKGVVNGVMTVHYRPGASRTEEQNRFIEALAGQAAIAIESAFLFEDLIKSRNDLEAAYDETLEGWGRALDLRDHETEGHSRRVTDLSVALATRLGLSEEEIHNIRRGALLHDIGKIGIPDHILLKPGPLTEEEWSIMRRHPRYGRDILAPINFLTPAMDIPYCHHEKWDGSGYPQGLEGNAIPLAARIFALADVWDALVFDRPYRNGWGPERVRDFIRSQAGTHFDPSLVPAFLELVMDWHAIAPSELGAETVTFK